jgi:site-specific DNA-methyltransferase (adenine-specific)
MQPNTIIQGDALEELKKLESESVNCIMTSPPYWALRDYGTEGQLGLEPTFEEYINKLCDIFDEAKRVLRKEGTCWVNLGDTYRGTTGVVALKQNKKFIGIELNLEYIEIAKKRLKPYLDQTKIETFIN